jgi:triosephosphate isomerase (TIM)
MGALRGTKNLYITLLMKCSLTLIIWVIYLNKPYIEVVVSPTNLHISMVKFLSNKKYKIGAQNISKFGQGAYTGEVSADQLANMGIEWTIIGHSERRSLFNESDEDISLKLTQAQKSKLNSILCVGETHEQKEQGTTHEVLKHQLESVKSSIDDWSKVVIAYEPVWAIGAGKTATSEEAQKTHEFIRSWVNKNVSEKDAQQLRIIYGGSVKDTN